MKRGTLVKTSVVMLFVTIILQLLARSFPAFGEWYATTIYPVFLWTVSRLFSLLPFSAAEFFLYGGVFFLPFFACRGILRCVRKKKCWKDFLKNAGVTVLFITSFGLLGFTVTCGINYHRIPFSEKEDFVLKKTSLDELEVLCRYLGERLSEERALVEGWQKGSLGEEAIRCMQALGEDFESLSGYYSHPKPIQLSFLLSYQEIQGIYTPYTIEANYNRDIPIFHQPHTICHELSHLKGFMREDEANFIGFLACLKSELPEFRYSGYMTAFIYSTNALYRNGGKEAYSEIFAELPEEALADMRENTAFWKQYEGPVAEVSNRVNDTYLRINAQTDGVKSYGRMVDLLLAWYATAP